MPASFRQIRVFHFALDLLEPYWLVGMFVLVGVRSERFPPILSDSLAQKGRRRLGAIRRSAQSKAIGRRMNCRNRGGTGRTQRKWSPFSEISRWMDWLRAPRRAMCVSARKEERATHARPETSQIVGDNLAETSFAGIVSNQGFEATVERAIRHRATASRQPRAADPCGGISDPGASSRRTQTIHSQTPGTLGQRRTRRTTAAVRAGDSGVSRNGSGARLARLGARGEGA